ncbi:helix-turn-helix domain-containing protein [Kordia sp. YSTF-M3]|uniref:Helix-turn-helix domain-containing protein n=1 Tax=Kordia aestuariivivens TaxID=2759037 RepID=A0ABR7Q9Q2_9FLAO|nr:AraC family transcriptional regulator [Kordia aestuariivivens]MBC8755257.1 helix-turn-helix domain-containing protein [Kordia aestuariivivens]
MNTIIRVCYVIIICFSFSSRLHAQTILKDTLDEKSFDELKKIFYHNKNLGKTKAGKRVALYTLSKARAEGNKKAIVNSFIRLCRVSYDNPELALKYTDSSILYATEYKLEKLLAEGHFYRGIVLFNSGKYGYSLKSYLEANKYYHDKNNETSYVLNHNIALLKLKIGSSREALSIFKKNLKYFERQENFGDLYLNTLYGLSIAYISNNKKDSASIINKRGYKLAKKTKGFSHLYFTQAEGALQYTKGNFIIAKDSLLKSVPFLKASKDYPNLAISYFYLGSISKVEETKIEYYKKVDSIFKFKKYIIPQPRKAYEGLINYYKSKGDLKNQLYYTDRLLVVDTVINKEYRNVSRTFHYEYDTPRLVASKEVLISELNKKNKDFKYGIYILLVILILVLIILISLYRRKKINEQKFKEIISSLKTKSVNQEVNKDKEKKRVFPIDNKTLNQILDGLDEFEKNKTFLTPKLTLNLFAKKLETNTKYLSIVINDYKSQTFKNYVNNLRIVYIVEELYNNNILRNYTINAIAIEAGFSSTESFTRAFFKKTGLNVSYFLKKIND